MKILNLFAGIGGNRKLWKGHSVTAVENSRIAVECYQRNFPDDIVYVWDVYNWFKKNEYDLSEFDFVWASPPCTTHTCLQMSRGYNIPNMTDIYGIMTFLKYSRKDKPWVVENVRPWYAPLVEPTAILGRHYFWSNFHIPKRKFFSGFQIRGVNRGDNSLSYNQLKKLYRIDTKTIDDLPKLTRRQILRNCTEPEIGLYILNEYIRQQKHGLDVFFNG